MPLSLSAHPLRPWRVLFVITSSDVGGSEKILRDLVCRLDRRAFEPVVCSLRPCGRVAQQIADRGTRVLSLEMSDRPRVGELIAGTIRLARWLDALDIDLVQSFLYRANALSALAARLARRRPLVIAGQRSLHPLGGRRAALAARCTRRFYHRIVAVSGAVQQQLIASEGFDPDRIVVIPNGVDTDHYTAGSTAAVRRALGVEPGTVVVGAVGRLSAEKGFDHLIASVADGRRQGLPLSLVLAGDGPQRARLEHQAQALGLNGHARFLGVCGDARPVYQAMDIFALPSLQEGSPNALLEAMASERAVVATAVGGVTEIVEHERSGLLVAPGAHGPLADSVARLAADAELRERLRRAARRRVRERFDVARMADNYAALYAEVLHTRRGVPHAVREAAASTAAPRSLRRA